MGGVRRAVRRPERAGMLVLRGDALSLPLANDSVDLVVTSPPYFRLRSYQDGGEHYDGQLGDEPSPAEYVDALLAATREMIRVVKPTGSIWVNLGDKYSTGSGGQSNLAALGERLGTGGGQKQDSAKRRSASAEGFPPKTLLGIPWRYANRCVDELGLILRAEVIWSKLNGLPESVTDRVRRSHEQWFHFVTQPRYFAAVDEIREPYSQVTLAAYANGGAATSVTGRHPSSGNGSQHGGIPETWEGNPLGRTPGSVWEVSMQPFAPPEHLGIEHFAAFPMEWPRRIIQGWSPSAICTACGEGRRPVVVRDATGSEQHGHRLGGRHESDAAAMDAFNRSASGRNPWRSGTYRTITEYECACDEPNALTRPAVVLDPFGGTGTTATVARAWGRYGISVDKSRDYCRLADWRTHDEAQIAAAMLVEKPPTPTLGQEALF